MKVIPVSKAKARLSHYGRQCRTEQVVVTVGGRPAFQLVAIDDDDDLVERLMKHNPRFRKLLEDRLKEKSSGISIKEALRRIGH